MDDHCPTPLSGLVNRVGDLVAQGLMGTLTIKKGKVLNKSERQFAQAGIYQSITATR